MSPALMMAPAPAAVKAEEEVETKQKEKSRHQQHPAQACPAPEQASFSCADKRISNSRPQKENTSHTAAVSSLATAATAAANQEDTMLIL